MTMDAGVKGRLKAEYPVGMSTHVSVSYADLSALLASHDALRAENERLKENPSHVEMSHLKSELAAQTKRCEELQAKVR